MSQTTPSPIAETAKHFVGKRARAYDTLIRQVVPGYDTLHAMARLILASEVGSSADILVAGAGTGMEIVELGKQSPAWRFLGVDPSAEMLAVASERLQEAGLTDRAELFAGRCEEVPDDRGPFDAATLLLTMHFIPDDGAKQSLLTAIARRLKVRAPLILCDMHAEVSDNRFNRFVGLWRQWQLDAGMPPEDVEKGFQRIVKDIHFVPEGRILELLHNAGFKTVEPFFGAFLFGGWIAWKD